MISIISMILKWIPRLLTLSVLTAVALFRLPSAIASTEVNASITIESDVAHVLPPEAYSQRISLVHEHLGDLVKPDSTKITIGRLFIFSVYDYWTYEVYVGVKPAAMGPFNPEVNLTTLTHEYGHAIFDKNLTDTLPAYRNLKLKIKEDESALFSAKEDSLETQSLLAEQEKLETQWMIASAIHEIFADALTLVVSKDPHAFKNVLSDQRNPVAQGSAEALLLRDFTDAEKSESFAIWKAALARKDYTFEDIYFSFLPVRWALWDISKDNLHDEEFRKVLLAKTFSVLKSHLADLLKMDSLLLKQSDAEKIEVLNKSIIQDLKKIH